jgi:hypothetical protein
VVHAVTFRFGTSAPVVAPRLYGRLAEVGTPINRCVRSVVCSVEQHRRPATESSLRGSVPHRGYAVTL